MVRMTEREMGRRIAELAGFAMRKRRFAHAMLRVGKVDGFHDFMGLARYDIHLARKVKLAYKVSNPGV